MTAAEAQAFADRGWTPWVEVAAALTQIEGGTQTPTTTPELSIAAGAAVTEGGGATFTLTASPAPSAALAVTLTVSQSGDFAASGTTGSRTVTVPAGGTATFTVATVDDGGGRGGRLGDGGARRRDRLHGLRPRRARPRWRYRITTMRRRRRRRCRFPPARA